MSGDEAAWRVVYRGAEPAAKVSGLAPGASVRLRVCAANSVGRGAHSDPRTFSARPLPPAPPDPPTFSQLQPDSVKVRWPPPEVTNGRVWQILPVTS